MGAKKIYIAEDEMNIRKDVQEFLELDGHATIGFENGDLLFQKFKEEEADLVILDIVMPGSPGYKICKELRKISKVPIVMLSARDSDLDYSTAKELRK